MLCLVIVSIDSFIRIVSEYETFKERASKVPDDSKEMMELIEYIEDARTNLVTDLKASVEVSLNMNCYNSMYKHILTRVLNMWLSSTFSAPECVSRLLDFSITMYATYTSEHCMMTELLTKSYSLVRHSDTYIVRLYQC